MTAAEKLRAEMAQRAPFSKDEFINKISEMIRHYGRSRFICDRHIGQTDIHHYHTIRMADEHTAIDFAEAEGFRVSYDYNGYGVRSIVFTL